MKKLSPAKKFALFASGLFLVAIITTIVDSSSDAIDIPFVPDISINGREVPELFGGNIISNAEYAQYLTAAFKKTPRHRITLADRNYQILNHNTFVDFTYFMQRFYWESPELRYKPESYDCDNFARSAVVIADLASPTMKGQMAFFRIYVNQRHSWGGVPAGGNHALCGFISEKGVFVYEPQTGAITAASKYPNADYVFSITAD